jgi:short-subunit dehydrogenase
MITGASDGIGLETARQYVAEGARVLFISRETEKLRAAADSLGDAVEVASFDLTDRTATESLLQSLDAQPEHALRTTFADRKKADRGQRSFSRSSPVSVWPPLRARCVRQSAGNGAP